MKFKYITILILVLGFALQGCESFLDISPEDDTVVLEKDALKTKGDLQELLNAGYDVVNGFYGGRFQRTSELLADNMELKSSITDELVNIYKRYTTGYFTDNESYEEAYRCIMRVNTVMENVDNVSDMDDDTKTRMIAESKFLRAIAHFAVVRLFAQPYGFTTDNSHAGIVIKTNTKVELLARSTVKDVYDAIIKDLKDAETDLPLENSNGVYATQWAAKAALAMVYFQMLDYENAYVKANDVITNGGFVFDTDVNQRFLTESEGDIQPSNEGIFYLASDPVSGKSVGGDFGVFRSDGTNNPNVRISSDVYKKEIVTNAGDLRVDSWYEVKNPGADNEFVALTKFNRDYNNIPVFYLTQQMLIRAESALLKNSPEVSVAITDVNTIRERAYGDASKNLLEASDASVVLEAVRKEFRLELMGEGMRLHNLKRRGAGGEENVLVRGVEWDYVGLVIQFAASEPNELFEANPEPN